MKKPCCANFSSGPCTKYPGWLPPEGTLMGRSHRSEVGVAAINSVIDLQKKILNIPDDYFVSVLSGSTSGAIEALLWSLLGERGVDLVSHCVFSKLWTYSIRNELRISDTRVFSDDFPNMSSVTDVDFDRDVVFCWASTTSGTSFKNANWISADRKGLTICDAASAVFALDLDWSKLDATAFSWQKGLGGEAGFGTVVLSPRAISRLETHVPSWPMPRIFKLSSDGKVNFGVFRGETLNTPSMLCIEDFHNALLWAEKLGGGKALFEKVMHNYSVVKQRVAEQNIYRFLVSDENQRAPHIICLDISTDRYFNLSVEQKWKFLKNIAAICEREGCGFDFLGHIRTEPHLRVWAGPTVEANDLADFLPWLEFAYNEASNSIATIDIVGFLS